MDQEIEIISSETRKEKIKNFFINNKKTLISVLLFFLIILFGFFFYKDYEKRNRDNLADKYYTAIIQYESGDTSKILESMKNVIEQKDKTYSPLAFYFLIDNQLISSQDEINSYFDLLINELDLEDEIKNLTIYKKGLFNSDFVDENKLLEILNPVIKSESMWKSHALYLMAEYLFDKNQKQKAKEFYNQILSYKKSNNKIVQETQKRLRRDFSE